MDNLSAELLRMIENGVLPHLELSPVSALSQAILTVMTALLPRRFFTDLKGALEAHIDFGGLTNLVKPDSPVLLLGAAENSQIFDRRNQLERNVSLQ
jgi:NTE family protein